MKKTEILQKLGLNNKESKIYLSLVRSGPATISSISKNTGIHRPIIYNLLPNLKDKGLISVFPKGKQKLYVAESPEKLQTLLSGLSLELESIVPELKSIYQSKDKQPLVKFLEGKEGIIFVFDDLVTSLKRGDIFYRYSSAKDTKKANDYLPKDYRKKRDQKQLERFVITSEETAKTKKPRLERDVKVISNKDNPFKYNITQVIYGDKVAFVDYNTETTLIIENPIIAEFQKMIFKSLYRKL